MKRKYIRYSKGWLYVLFHSGIELMLHVFFKKIMYHNRGGVPGAKPVILAANHPTAFVDPLMLCLFLDPPLYNMTRGDIFKKTFFRKLLEQFNMFPVFRVRDGYSQRGRNDEVFEFCIERLKTNHTVTIYVEGEHHLSKELKPIQKGIARIAFGAYERYRQEDLQIIPAACNYWKGDIPRDTAYINIGTPIYVRDYWADYQENPGQAVLKLCADIEKALLPYTYHIEDQSFAPVAERLLTLLRNRKAFSLWPSVTYKNTRFFEEKALLDAFNQLETTQKENLEQESLAYFEALNKAGLQDEALMRPAAAAFSQKAGLLLTALPALFGYISVWPLYKFAQRFTASKIKKPEFKTSVYIGVAGLLGHVYLLIFLLVAFLVGNPYAIAAAILLPLFWWFAFIWRDWWRISRAASKALHHPQRAELLALRKRIHLPSL
jgi:glycerol-3-phosphate O-acyltransferase / dihydroxyacetone phosphate acyltransferase